ncbi:hypothetical protein GOP47_0027546 [Adiantum capillus-veneris]|nr:hypothetical protein GOP47_0027546 [Adiantum capillus-veneris]
MNQSKSRVLSRQKIACVLKGMHRTIAQKVTSRLTHSVNAVSETYVSLKDLFERHKVVLTLAASLGSAGAAWAGYTARQLHQKRVEARLDTIEHVMTNVHNLEEKQVKALTSTGVTFMSCAATAGTTFVLGYGLGWRGGRWYMIKKIQKQQQKLLAPPKVSRLSRLRASFRLKSRGVTKSMEPKEATSNIQKVGLMARPWLC